MSDHYHSDLYKAKNAGAAGEGTHHWWQQRMTAIALVPLALWAMWQFKMSASNLKELMLK